MLRAREKGRKGLILAIVVLLTATLLVVLNLPSGSKDEVVRDAGTHHAPESQVPSVAPKVDAGVEKAIDAAAKKAPDIAVDAARPRAPVRPKPKSQVPKRARPVKKKKPEKKVPRPRPPSEPAGLSVPRL
jgi:hypothetical protein